MNEPEKNKALSLIKEAADAFGIRIQSYGEDLSGLDDYDDGLRRRILQKNDAGAAVVRFLQSMKPGNMYLQTDAYACRYCFFMPPSRVRR
ncbi:MAG: hypothetical protein LBF60_06990 [Treponema sp.]|jgi:hypothetical protein|nr:hypothetical protein [Treponema sp.]